MEAALGEAGRARARAEGALLEAARGVYAAPGSCGGGAAGDAALAGCRDAAGRSFLPAGVAEAAAECLELSRRAEALDAELAGLEAAGGLEAALRAAAADVRAGRFLAAGDALGSFAHRLSAADAAGLVVAGEVAELRARAVELEDSLEQGLSGALDAAVSTGGAPPAPAVRVEANVRDTLAALAARGLLVEQLGRLSGRLLEAAGPLLGGASAVRAEVGGGPEGVRTLSWTPIPGGSGGSRDGGGVGTGGTGSIGWAEGVEALLRFTAEDVLGGDAFSLRLLAVRMWPDIAQVLVEGPLLCDAAGRPGFERVAERLVTLEARARDLGFLPGDEETGEPAGPGPLERFAESAVQTLVEGEQQGCVRECRRLLLAWDASAPPERRGEPLPHSTAEMVAAGLRRATVLGAPGGCFTEEIRVHGALEAFAGRHAPSAGGASASFFAKGEGAVTPCAVAVGAIMQGALAELRGCEEEDAFRALCLLGALRHAAVMCRLLPSASRGGSALAKLRGASLYSNDCEYLAEEVPRTLAGWCAPTAVRPAVTDLLNSLQELRRGGYSYVDRQLQEEVEALLDDLDGARAFERSLDPEQRRGIAGAMADMARRLRGLRRELVPLLRPFAYAKAAGSVLQSVLDRVVQELLDLPAISAAESEALPELLAPLLEAAAQLVQGSEVGEASGAGGGGSATAGAALAARAFAPGLPKLKATVGLLEAPLRDVVHRWEQGLLPAVGLSSSEVAGLIEALFEDSPLRQSSLAAITRVHIPMPLHG